MFSSTKKVTRGQCSCCGQVKSETVKLYILDIKDTDYSSWQGKWVPQFVEADNDFAACLKCWKFIGGYISNHVRVTSYE